jgi:hypothetical protein
MSRSSWAWRSFCSSRSWVYGALELAGEALAVEAEIRERFGLLLEGGGDSHGVLKRVSALDGEREDVAFEGGDAVQAPSGVG